MSRFAETVVSSVGSHGLMKNVESRPGSAPSVHIAGNSFNLQLRGTNFFNHNTNVGCYWSDVSSVITAEGLYNFPAYSYKALVFQVNSVAGTVALSVG